MIDPATGWFEMAQIKDARADTVANAVEQTWLTRYPRPDLITYDRGREFLAEFATMVTEDYGIQKKGITTRNPQANAIIERVHQTMGQILRTYELNDLNDEDPFSGILASTMYAIRALVHTTLRATPMQLVFGRDAVLNTKFEADWDYIKRNKQQLINKNNERENAKRIQHHYNVDDKVLLRVQDESKYGSDPWKGPYTILRVNNNGTVRLQLTPNVTDTVNIRLLKPYHE